MSDSPNSQEAHFAEVVAALNGRRLGDDAPFDRTDDERARVEVTLSDAGGHWSVRECSGGRWRDVGSRG